MGFYCEFSIDDIVTQPFFFYIFYNSQYYYSQAYKVAIKRNLIQSMPMMKLVESS